MATLERNKHNVDVQWGKQVFTGNTLPVLQVFPPTKTGEVCNFYCKYTSTVRDVI